MQFKVDPNMVMGVFHDASKQSCNIYEDRASLTSGSAYSGYGRTLVSTVDSSTLIKTNMFTDLVYHSHRSFSLRPYIETNRRAGKYIFLTSFL